MGTAAPMTCEVCEKRPDAVCVHCGGPACRTCDRCYGCRRLICPACDTGPAPTFFWPGDAWRHPHSGPEGLVLDLARPAPERGP